MDASIRLRILEDAMAELLESELNSSLVIGVRGRSCDPLVVTAIGCSVRMALGPRASVLATMASLERRESRGPRALAVGCEHALRTAHGLSARFAPTLWFEHPVNRAGFIDRFAQWPPRWTR
jgi:hypothetical protein